MTTAGQFCGSTMSMVALALIMSVVVTNIYNRKDSSQQLPRRCLAFMSRCRLVGTGNARTKCKNECTTRNQMVQDIVEENNSGNEVEDTLQVAGERQAETSEDWVSFAKFIDRICFWIYVALSLCLGLAIVVQSFL